MEDRVDPLSRADGPAGRRLVDSMESLWLSLGTIRAPWALATLHAYLDRHDGAAPASL
jgi:hypothetical protein